MRSDAEILAWIAPLFNPGVDASTDPILVDRYERIEGALSVGLKGRECLEAAMGAVLMEVGDPLPLRTGVQQIADHLEACNREHLPACDNEVWSDAKEVFVPADIEFYVERGAAIAAKIDELQRDKIMLETAASSGDITPEQITAHERLDVSQLGADGELVKEFIDGPVERWALCPRCDRPFHKYRDCEPRMTDKAKGHSYAALIAVGWTHAGMLREGMIEAPTT